MYKSLSKSVSILNTSPSSLNRGILIICFYFNSLLRLKESTLVKGDTDTKRAMALIHIGPYIKSWLQHCLPTCYLTFHVTSMNL